MRKKFVIFLGPPGSGKGTQAHLLSEKIGSPAISMGDLLRAERDKGTPLGEEIKERIDHGNMVSDELAEKVVYKRLEGQDVRDGFILDGFPRNKEQLKSLEKKFNGISVPDHEVVAIYIQVSDSEVEKRLSKRRVCSGCGASYHLEHNPSKKKGVCDECGGGLHQREDDKPEVIKHRLEEFHSRIAPLLEEFRNKGWLITVDGEKKIEEIHQDILGRI